MRFSATLASALLAPMLVSAAPVRRAANPSDVLVLQFAHVLEQLETQFYQQALKKFVAQDFVDAGFVDPQVAIEQFTIIQNDEATHTSILETTLVSIGAQPITSCTFNFDSVLGSVSQMAPVARVVENLGVAAYLGAAHLVTDPTLLTAAASIATVEARHQTVLNLFNGGSAIPSAFDLAFSPSEVLAIASPFISGCDLGVPANPTLTVTNTGTVAPGTMLTFQSSAINGTIPTSNLTCQMLVGGAPEAIVLPFDQCQVPNGINGPVAIFIVSDQQPVSIDVQIVLSSVVAGPTIAFIDTIQDSLSSAAIKGSGSSSSSSSNSSSSSSAAPPSASSSSSDSSSASASASAAVSSSSSVTTISPNEASSILASASATATATDSAAAAASTSTSNNNSQGSTSNFASAGGPNLYTGPVSNGTLTVVGWSQVPKPQ
ncbi:ferritin-like domain-containing protein [Irpex rosettiformis]|uniref:Ferritin-like domain-containing protein n=1 Tax=Irpex rosettiformis TaxID=378272 RepID=A0ACB8UEA8_9APHY|nr:ferritin-like domain-containing protein [Irpex rosettiformis]